MNTKLRAVALVLVIFIGLGITQHAEARTEVTLDIFYDALSPYGEWIEHDYYGYIWQPLGVGEYWQPYRDGNWQYSDEGWIWVSNEPWGWATYHYGRWVPDEYYGWVWIPGVDWAPAYVEWYDSPGYIGWAPRQPDRNFFLEIGVSIGGYGYYQPAYSFNFNYYKPYKKRYKKHRRHKKHYYYPPAEHCVYVPYEHFSHKNAKLVAVSGPYNTVVHRNTTNITNVTVINNKTIYKGPDRHRVEHRSGKKIKRVNVVDRDLVQVRGKRDVNKLRGEKYNVYRPKVVKKGHERPNNISKRYNGAESYKEGSGPRLKKKVVNTQNKDTVVNRGGRDFKSGFKGSEGYKKDAAIKYTSKSKANKSRSQLSPAKNQKHINRNKTSAQYQSPGRSQLKKNSAQNTQVQRNRNKSQNSYKQKGSKLRGKSERDFVSQRNYNAQSVKNNRKSYKASDKSLSPAKTQKSKAAYKTKKPNVTKVERRQKGFNTNKANQRVNKRSTSRANNTYKKASGNSASKRTSKSNISKSSVKRSFNNKRSAFKGSSGNSINRQVRR